MEGPLITIHAILARPLQVTVRIDSNLLIRDMLDVIKQQYAVDFKISNLKVLAAQDPNHNELPMAGKVAHFLRSEDKVFLLLDIAQKDVLNDTTNTRSNCNQETTNPMKSYFDHRGASLELETNLSSRAHAASTPFEATTNNHIVNKLRSAAADSGNVNFSGLARKLETMPMPAMKMLPTMGRALLSDLAQVQMSRSALVTGAKGYIPYSQVLYPQMAHHPMHMPGMQVPQMGQVMPHVQVTQVPQMAVPHPMTATSIPAHSLSSMTNASMAMAPQIQHIAPHSVAHMPPSHLPSMPIKVSTQATQSSSNAHTHQQQAQNAQQMTQSVTQVSGQNHNLRTAQNTQQLAQSGQMGTPQMPSVSGMIPISHHSLSVAQGQTPGLPSLPVMPGPGAGSLQSRNQLLWPKAHDAPTESSGARV